MKQQTVGYIAGFLDADGCISLNKQGKRLKPIIVFGNTNKAVLKYMQLELGFGKIYGQSTATKPNWKKEYFLKIQTYKDIAKFLDIIYPFLVLKKKHAFLLKEFVKNHALKEKKSGRGNKGKTYFTDDDCMVYERIKELNKKGV